MPRLFGAAWEAEFKPWIDTRTAAVALEDCFTQQLFYSNLQTELFSVIQILRVLKKAHSKQTLGSKAETYLNDYLDSTIDKKDPNMTEKVGHHFNFFLPFSVK